MSIPIPEITLHKHVDLKALGRDAQQASRALTVATTEEKNAALHAIAESIERHADTILAANAEDVARGRANGLTDALLDRLLLTPARLQALADDARKVAELPDPVGREFDQRTLANGLRLKRRTVPLGVVGVIYEARPNVTVDIATLCLKAGNAALLRGGSETIRSNVALAQALAEALASVGLPEACVQLIDSTDRALVRELLRLDDYVDMIIPRGGAGLHRLCKEHSTIPVITGGIGICHLFVDATADLDRAIPVIVNAKVQRPSVCNALDTLLVHEGVAADFLPRVAAALAEQGVEVHADEAAHSHLANVDGLALVKAGADDFDQEWLGLTLGLRVVNSLDTAIAHVHAHSTQHSDGILTETPAHAARFLNEVDSAAVYVNASTRFTDGGQFGLGAEVAVSTQKLHARGPMGLDALTTFKWIAEGDYHVRA
ncbi:MAG: glutamate-5-semialdehyde dehydrogenase [Bacteroidota bacterium]